jgi:hypothetical protein
VENTSAFELAEGLKEDQIRESIQREQLERSYLDVVKSKQERPPASCGFCKMPLTDGSTHSSVPR